MKVVATNRKAYRDYDIIERYEAGIVLCGNEVKSLRTRGCSINESFARVENGEIFLYNMHIPEFEKSSYFKPDPKRIRKLLLHKKEIERLFGLTQRKGFTIIPLKVFFSERGFAKVEIALVKGRPLYDKRKKIKEEIVSRHVQRILKRYNKKS
ncbi:MAG: SsrA-binding protein SmpB [Candidatus Omnitrophica bacterium]|nr:SsrA-binding protein SmpB [Candidatus Omnitrophota bacterium]MCM8831008.1 SsrA-binding protein SmpB [Candidatus Omnitrophota bacterium]